MPVFKVWNISRTIRKAVKGDSYEEFLNQAKSKLGIPEGEPVTVFTEDDGTELDEDTFLEFSNTGNIFVIGRQSESWTSSQEHTATTDSMSCVTKEHHTQSLKQGTLDGSVYIDVSEDKKWEDVNLGFLPHGGKHQDTLFSNNMLRDFYVQVRPLIPSNVMFRKHFIEERSRQWNICKEEEKIRKSFEFLRSNNMAGIGNRLHDGYVPKGNDGNILSEVSDNFHTLSVRVQSLIDDIKRHDNSLFESSGRLLNNNWQQFHHSSNEKLTSRLLSLQNDIVTLSLKSKETANRFKLVLGNRKGHKKTASAKKRINMKKNEKRKEKIFQRNIQQLIQYILTEEGQQVYKEGHVVHDCDIKVSREEPLVITGSRVRHLVCLFKSGQFTNEAICTLIDLVPDNLSGKLFEKMENGRSTESSNEAE